MNDCQDWADWIGRSFTVHDIASAPPIIALDALLERPPRDEPLVPPLDHWLYFLPVVKQSELGVDGHPRLGTLLPDLGLPRRMWAGSRVQFHRPIEIGAAITRRTTIRSIEMKRGSSGRLGFVTLSHETSNQDTLLVSEEQSLVYREAFSAPNPEQAQVVAPTGHCGGKLLARKRFDPVELFRFSALTGNAHRIHFDAEYARDCEGYAGLVVHGPFQAMFLMDLFRRNNPQAAVSRFEFRATAPLFMGDEASVFLEGQNPVTLRISSAGRPSSMVATIYSE